MENGVGVIEETPVQEVKVDDDEVSEVKIEEKEVVADHGLKGSDGFEVFGEVVKGDGDGVSDVKVEGKEVVDAHVLKGSDESEVFEDVAVKGDDVGVSDVNVKDNEIVAAHEPRDSEASEVFEDVVKGDDVGVSDVNLKENEAVATHESKDSEGSEVFEDVVKGDDVGVSDVNVKENEVVATHKSNDSEGSELFEDVVKGDDVGVSDVNVKENEVTAAHEPKDSEGSEVFEEVVKGALDEGDDGLRPDSDGVGSSVIGTKESNADFSMAEGSSRMLGEVDITENSIERSEEGEGNNEESTETRVESIVDNVHEGSVTTIDDNGGVAHEELLSGDEEVTGLDTGLSSVIEDKTQKPSQGEGSEIAPLKVKEIKAIDGDEETVEKSVVMESSNSKDIETLVQDGPSGSVAKEEVKGVITNRDFDNVNEMVRELENPPVDIPSESKKEKVEEHKETLSGSVKSDGIEVVSSSVSQKLEDSVGVEPENVLGETISKIDEGNKDGEVLHDVHRNGGPKIEVKSSDTSSSVAGGASSIKEDVNSQNVSSDLGTRTHETNINKSPDKASHGIHVSDGKKTKEESEVHQPRKETTVKTTETSTTSSEKSSKSVVPPAQPAGLGRTASLLGPAPRASHQPRANGQATQAQTNIVEDTTNGEAEEGDEIREKLQMIRVKFLRLAHRLGQTPHNVVVAQVLYRLGLAEQLRARNGGRVGAFSFDRASAMAEQLEAAGQEPLDFSCTIMVLGKTGVGKSATINSIFDEVKFSTDAFQMGTKKVQDVVGTVQGIKVRVIDTPGLLTSCADQHQNEKILHSVKHFIKKSPPDIVLYLDRLDMPSRDFGDMPLLRTITEIFGPSIWFNAIVVLTHAASAPPEGPNGTASTYDMFVTQRSHAVQQVIRQAAGDMRLMNPVSLVENHSACRTNRAGQRVLPNGQVWKPHLLLLSFASKILAEANILLKLQDTPPGKPFTARARAPPLPFLLSSLLQSRPQLKLPEEQYGDDDDDAMDDDLDVGSDSDEESAYDELPPFKPLTKAQLAKLPKDQKKAYYDELEYREKLFMKKQLKEEKRRQKMMKKMAASAKDMMPSTEEYKENVEEESGGAASLPVPVPDLALPATFDSDNPTHRYRYLDTSNQWLVRPVLDNHGWDHDVGYEGINIERMFAVKDKLPVSFSGQISKDKKESNLQLEVASSVKHGEGKATTMGFDMQSVGKDMAYTLRSETRFSNYRRNKATAGLSATLIGDALSAGLKVEDKLIINKQMRVVMSGGAMAGRGDVAYGGSFEATFRDKDYPVGRFLSTLGLSIIDWHGELALGCNVQSNIPIGRAINLVARANLNNRGSGQVSLRVNSTEQLQLALIAFLPLIRKIMGMGQDPSGY